MNKPWTVTKLFIGLCKKPNSPKLYWPLLFIMSPDRKEAKKRWLATEVGGRVVKEKLNLVETLKNLSDEKKGSVAEYYKAFCIYWEVDTSIYFNGVKTPTKPEDYILQRSIVSHDLSHVILNYDASIKGEMQLMMYQFSQTKNWGFFLFAMAMAWRFISSPYLLIKAYNRGKRTLDLRFLDWETILGMDMKEIRRMFT